METKPEILHGKRKRKPRRVLQMHMGSSRTYGFGDGNEVEDLNKAKQHIKQQSPSKKARALAACCSSPREKNKTPHVKTVNKRKKSNKKNSIDKEKIKKSSSHCNIMDHYFASENVSEEEFDDELPKNPESILVNVATESDHKSSFKKGLVSTNKNGDFFISSSNIQNEKNNMLNLNINSDDDTSENSEVQSTNQKNINTKQKSSYGKKAMFSLSPSSPDSSAQNGSGSKKSRVMDNAQKKHHAFSVQTVLKLVPGMEDNNRSSKNSSHTIISSNNNGHLNLLSAGKNFKQWHCLACGDLNRPDQDVCSLCFTINEAANVYFELKNDNNNCSNNSATTSPSMPAIATTTKIAAAATTNRSNGSSNITVTPTRKDDKPTTNFNIVAPLTLSNSEWKTSETFIRWWRRGLMTALQYKLPLLFPPVSSQLAFRHQNNVHENRLSIQPRVTRLGQDKWVQCNMCLKYRRLPSSVSVSELPKMWFCRYNKYDPHLADCRASEEQFTYYDDHVKELSDDHDTLAFLDKLRHYYDVTGKVVRLRSLTLGGRELSLYRLYNEVQARGGCAQVMSEKGTWAKIFRALENYSKTETSASFRLKNIYRKYLLEYENHQRALATANNEPLPSECAAPITMMT